MDVSALGLPAANGAERAMPDRTLNDSPGSIIPEMACGVIAIVDPVSTGACLAFTLAGRGHKLVRVWSDMCPDAVKAHTKKGMEVTYEACLQYRGDLNAIVDELAKCNLIVHDVCVGCETGGQPLEKAPALLPPLPRHSPHFVSPSLSLLLL